MANFNPADVSGAATGDGLLGFDPGSGLEITPLGSVALTTLFLAASPAVQQKIGLGLANLGHKVVGLYDSYAPETAKSWLSSAGSVASTVWQVTYYGSWAASEHTVSVNESVDFSIQKSKDRLYKHDEKLPATCDFIADQAVEVFLGYHESLKNIDYLKKLSFMGYSVSWAIDFWKKELAESIRAFVLNLLANLADQGFDPEHPFEDENKNPLGRIFSVIGNCLYSFEERLEKIKDLPENERDPAYKALFAEMSTTLLSKIFPNGSNDIRLFHHTLRPGLVIESLLWPFIQSKFPVLLESIYRDTRPVSEENPGWEKKLDERTGIPHAHKAVHAPSAFFQQFVRDDQGKAVKALEPDVEKFLKEQKYFDTSKKDAPNAKAYSEAFVEYIRQFAVSKDPTVCRMGSFVERYFMERILFNFSETADPGNPNSLINMHLDGLLNGDFFRVFTDHLSGKILPTEMYGVMTSAVLAPFGLDKESSFPLPSFLRGALWPKIQKGLTETLPELIKDKLFRWDALKEKETNQQKVNLALGGDSSLSQLLDQAPQWMDGLTKKLVDLPLAEKLNKTLTSNPLTKTSMDAINAKWAAFLNSETGNPGLQKLKDFAAEGTEALVYQVLADLQDCYAKRCGAKKDSPAGDEENPSSAVSFQVWMAEELAQALQLYNLSGLSQKEIKALRQAIHLKNAIKAWDKEIEKHKLDKPGEKKSLKKKLDQKQILQNRLDKLWPSIEPQFNQAKKHFLTLLGYDKAEKLPIPDPFKPHLGDAIDLLPKALFDQTSDLMLPLLDKARNQARVQKLPQGDLIIKGCKLLAEDIIRKLPDFIDSYHQVAKEMNEELKDTGMMKDEQVAAFAQAIEELVGSNSVKIAQLYAAREKILGEHAPYTVDQEKTIHNILKAYKLRICNIMATPENLVDQVPGEVPLSPKAKEFLAESLRTFINQEDPAYKPVWKWLESYIEGMALALVVSLGKFNKTRLNELKDLVAATKEELEKNPVEAESTLKNFTKQLFEWTEIESKLPLYGVPQLAGDKLVDKLDDVIKVNLAKRLLGVYELHQKVITLGKDIEERKLSRNLLPITDMASGFLAAAQYGLDYATDHLAKKEDGTVKGVRHTYESLNPWLDEQEKKGFGVAAIAKEALALQVATPYLQTLCELLDLEDTKTQKKDFVEYINPILIGHTFNVLKPWLKKEAKGQADNHAIIFGLIPLLTNHLRHLREASQKEGGLTFDNFAKVAENDHQLHEGVPTGGTEKQQLNQRREKFFNEQVDLLFDLVLPKEDLQALLGEAAPELIDPIWHSKKIISEKLADISGEPLLTQDQTVVYCNMLLNGIIEGLSKKVEIHHPEVEVLTPEEQIRQDQEDCMVGELIVEAARYADLPIDRLYQLPGFAKRMIGFESLEKSSFAAIGAAIRTTFHGDFFTDLLKEQFQKIAKYHFEKKTDAMKESEMKAEYENLEKLKTQVTHNLLVFSFKYFEAYIRDVTNMGDHPIPNAIKDAVITICSFVFMRIVGVLQLLKITNVVEDLVQMVMYPTIDHVITKSQKILTEPKIHENLIFHGVEAFEKVLMDEKGQNLHEKIESSLA